MQPILATHVDDLVWTCKTSAEKIIAKIKSFLILGTEDVHIFRYSGKEVTQDLGTFSIKSTCRATSEKLTESHLHTGRPKNLAAEASPEKRERLSTSVGTIAWIAR